MLSLLRKLIALGVGNLDFKVSVPEFRSQGHLTTNVAFILASRKKTSPMAAGNDLVKALLKKPAGKKMFSKIEIAHPGYINFWLSDEFLQSEFVKISKAKNKYGKQNLGRGKKIICEYSDPNIAKRMGVHHLRGTIIGDALANLYEFLGYKVVRWNYLGDWGTQFGQLISAYKLWGKKGVIEKNPIAELQKLYVRFHAEMKKNPELAERGRQEFKKLEEEDSENRKLWLWFKKESLKEFERIYKILGVSFTNFIGESFYEKDMKKLVVDLLRKGPAHRSEGAVIIPLDKFGLPPALIQKTDKASLYLTRDIANLKYRLKKYKPAKILYVVGNEQALHFQQLFAITKILDLDKIELGHIKYGLVLGGGGKKLATREGKAVVLEDVIDKAVLLAGKIVDKKNPDLPVRKRKAIAQAVGIGALKYNDLSQNRLSDINFDWQKMLSLEGNSAPYLQYTYARLKSILRKAGKRGRFSVKQLSGQADLDLVVKLMRFPDILEETANTYLPNYLSDYLYDLARETNMFYQTQPVLKSEPGLREARLKLIEVVAETLKTGLGILGIKTPEKI